MACGLVCTWGKPEPGRKIGGTDGLFEGSFVKNVCCAHHRQGSTSVVNVLVAEEGKMEHRIT